jgi:hypothetical protein
MRLVLMGDQIAPSLAAETRTVLTATDTPVQTSVGSGLRAVGLLGVGAVPLAATAFALTTGGRDHEATLGLSALVCGLATAAALTFELGFPIGPSPDEPHFVEAAAEAAGLRLELGLHTLIAFPIPALELGLRVGTDLRIGLQAKLLLGVFLNWGELTLRATPLDVEIGDLRLAALLMSGFGLASATIKEARPAAGPMPGLALSVGGRSVQLTLRTDVAIPMTDRPPKLFEGQLSLDGIDYPPDIHALVRAAWYLEIANAHGPGLTIGSALYVLVPPTNAESLMPEVFAGAVW